MINPMQLPEFEFRKVTLDNGLDLIIRHQPGLPIVAVNLWYHVGSKNEERRQRGFAHLFEHLMFEGSEHFPGDFFKHLQPFGANINGSTSSDRTNYFVDIPSAHLERVLAMESDRMGHLLPAIDQQKLRIQKGVVKNEYLQNYANRPYGMVGSLLAEAMYPPQHPYSWLTIGVMEDLESATLDDVSGFFRRHYVPANASLAIVGDIEFDRVTDLVQKYFGPIPGGVMALGPWKPVSESVPSRDLVLQDRVELDRFHCAWHTVPHFHDDDASLQLLGDILGRGKASRLYQSLVIENQLAQDVHAYQSGRELAGSFAIIVTMRPGRAIQSARELIDSEIRKLAEVGPSPQEIHRVVTMKTAGFLYSLEHMGGFGGVADRLNAYNVYRSNPALITTDLARFLEVTVDRIQQACSYYIGNPAQVCISVRGRRPHASHPSIDRRIPPQSSSPVAYLAPVPIVGSLSCGIPIWVLPQKGIQTLAMTVVSRGGASLIGPESCGLPELTANMMDEGTRRRSSSEIAVASESMGTSLSASCGWDGAFVSFHCLSTFLEESLDLAIDILREPSFPEKEWTRVHGQTLAALQAEHDSAEARAHRGLLTALYGVDHPYRFPLSGTEPVVAELSCQAVVEFHQRLFGPDQSAVIVAGDVDPEAIITSIERHLHGWSSMPSDFPAISSPEYATHPRIILLDRPGASQAVVRVGHVGLARSDSDFDHAMLVNQVLGGQFTSRLNERLREERGFTYGVRSYFDCRLGRGPFVIATSLQSDKLAEALEEIHRELNALIGGRPISHQELDDARRALVEGQARQFETPSALVNRYASLFIHGLPVDHHRNFAGRISAITHDSINESVHRFLHPGAMVMVVVADTRQVIESLENLEWAELERAEDR